MQIEICKIEDEVLDDYICNRLKSNEAKKIENHIFECRECLNKLLTRKDIILAFNSRKKLINNNISKEKIVASSPMKKHKRNRLLHIQERKKGGL